MSQIRRNPAVSDRATPTTPIATSKSKGIVNSCPVRGCVWRGTCPIHGTVFPPAFNAITDIIRRRPYGPGGNDYGDSPLDLDPEVRMRRLAYRSSESRCAADPFVGLLRDSWENLAAAVAA